MHMTERIFNALHTQNCDPSFVHWRLISKTKWKYFKITLLSFEITVYICIICIKVDERFESEDP
jgi:hypothetical protein